jgi:acyl-CoA dehydrogenase
VTAAPITSDEISDLTRHFIEKELRPLERDVDLSCDHLPIGVWKELVRKSRAVGLYSHGLPVEHGGGGFSAVQRVAVALEAGRTAMGIVPVLMGPPELVLAADSEQWKWFTAPLIEGDCTVAVGLTEASGGSDLAALRTTARLDGDDFVITGEKAFTSLADIADFIVVLAVSDPSTDDLNSRFTALIVPAEADGLAIQAMPKMGWHGGSTCQLNFDHVRVPQANVLGEVHRGWRAMFGSWINHGRLGNAAICTGSLGYALELATDYARGRVTFGKRLADHQVIQFWLADMQIEYDAALSYVMRAAEALDGAAAGTIDEPMARRLVAGAKVFTAEVLGKGVDTLMQIHGGAGVLTGTPVERLYRDARIFRIGEGTSEMMRQQMARSIVGRPSETTR